MTKSLQEWSDCYIGRTPSNVYLTRATAEKRSDLATKLQEIFFFGGGGGSGQTQRNQWLDYFFTGRYNDNQRVASLYGLYTTEQADIENYLGR